MTLNDRLLYVARTSFSVPFFEGDTLRSTLRAETPLALAYALVHSGLTAGQLNALALAVRTIGEIESEAPTEPLSGRQQVAWARLLVEKGLPDAFRGLLEAASPWLTLRRDVYALYGVLAGTVERLSSLAAVAQLEQTEPPKPQAPSLGLRPIKG